MKLAIVRQTYNPFGGAERFVERALAALADASLDVTLIARKWQGAARHPQLRCDPFYVGRLWRDWSFARCVARRTAGGTFDLVQSHERIPGCDIYRAGDGVHATWLELRAQTLGPWARLGQRLSPWHRYTLGAEARMFRDPRLKAVICNSRMVRDDIARRFGVAPDRLHVIYNGVDLTRFHPRLRQEHRERVRHELGIDGSAPLILFVGSGFARKGVGPLLRALAAMAQRDALLLVVGRDKEQRRFEALAARLGLGSRVRFLGGQQDVAPYYGAADCLALPTLYDPLPNAAVEALACGLPLVTSTTCGAAELVREGENGWLCGALDVAALAKALDRLCRPGAAAAMTPGARASVAHLSVETMAEHLIALYRELLRRGGAPRALAQRGPAAGRL